MLSSYMYADLHHHISRMPCHGIVEAASKCPIFYGRIPLAFVLFAVKVKFCGKSLVFT